MAKSKRTHPQKKKAACINFPNFLSCLKPGKADNVTSEAEVVKTADDNSASFNAATSLTSISRPMPSATNILVQAGTEGTTESQARSVVHQRPQAVTGQLESGIVTQSTVPDAMTAQQEQLLQLTSELQNTKKNVAQQMQELAASDRSLQAAQAHAKSAEQTADALRRLDDGRRSAMRAQVQAHQDELDEALFGAACLQDTTVLLEASNVDLRDLVQTTQAELDTAKQHVGAQQERVRQAEADKAATQERLQQLECMRAQQEATLTARVQDLQSELNVSRLAIAKAAGDAQEAKQELKTFQSGWEQERQVLQAKWHQSESHGQQLLAQLEQLRETSTQSQAHAAITHGVHDAQAGAKGEHVDAETSSWAIVSHRPQSLQPETRNVAKSEKCHWQELLQVPLLLMMLPLLLLNLVSFGLCWGTFWCAKGALFCFSWLHGYLMLAAGSAKAAIQAVPLSSLQAMLQQLVMLVVQFLVVPPLLLAVLLAYYTVQEVVHCCDWLYSRRKMMVGFVRVTAWRLSLSAQACADQVLQLALLVAHNWLLPSLWVLFFTAYCTPVGVQHCCRWSVKRIRLALRCARTMAQQVWLLPKQVHLQQALLVRLLQLLVLVMLLPMFLVQLPMLLVTAILFNITRGVLTCLQPIIRRVRLLNRCINITCRLVLLKVQQHRTQPQLLLMPPPLQQDEETLSAEQLGLALVVTAPGLPPFDKAIECLQFSQHPLPLRMTLQEPCSSSQYVCYAARQVQAEETLTAEQRGLALVVFAAAPSLTPFEKAMECLQRHNTSPDWEDQLSHAQEGVLTGVKDRMLLCSLYAAIAWSYKRRPGRCSPVLVIKAFTYAIAYSPLEPDLYDSRGREWDLIGYHSHAAEDKIQASSLEPCLQQMGDHAVAKLRARNNQPLHWRVLHLPKSWMSDAEALTTLNTAYRAMIMETHSDKHAHLPEDQRQMIEQLSVCVNLAKAALLREFEQSQQKWSSLLFRWLF